MLILLVEDSERNDGSAQKPYFMSSNLRKIFGHKNKRSWKVMCKNIETKKNYQSRAKKKTKKKKEAIFVVQNKLF